MVENSGVLFPSSALERALLAKLPSRPILLGACQDMDHSVAIRQLRVYVEVPLWSLLLAIFANTSRTIRSLRLLKLSYRSTPRIPSATKASASIQSGIP